MLKRQPVAPIHVVFPLAIYKFCEQLVRKKSLTKKYGLDAKMKKEFKKCFDKVLKIKNALNFEDKVLN